MKATDQIYPFLDFNATGYGDSIAVDTPLGRQWFPFNRGMDLRTYLAGQAMQGLCAVPYKGDFDSTEESIQKGAEYAVMYADALIVELNKEQK